MVVQVKFIKFFAWEERWIGRALDAREVEMQWMVKGADSGLSLLSSLMMFSLPPSSDQLRHVLPPLDVCPHFGVHCLVLRVCYARRRVDY